MQILNVTLDLPNQQVVEQDSKRTRVGVSAFTT